MLVGKMLCELADPSRGQVGWRSDRDIDVAVFVRLDRYQKSELVSCCSKRLASTGSEVERTTQ